MEIWDLLEKTHEPSQTQNISAASITYIKPWIVSGKGIANDHHYGFQRGTELGIAKSSYYDLRIFFFFLMLS